MDDDARLNKQLEDEIFGGDSDDELSDFNEELGELEEDEVVEPAKAAPSSSAAARPPAASNEFKIPRKTSRAPRKERRRSRRRDDDDDADVAEREKPVLKKNAGLVEFDATLDSLKSKKRSRANLDEAEIDEMIIKVCAQMRDAAYADIDANKSRQPAKAKLLMLSKISDLLQKSYMHEQLLDNNILDSVRLWLEPLPDGSLPSINIRQALMESLVKLPISTQHLRESKLGRVVMFYHRCEKELPALRKIAGDLIGEWSRPFVKRPTTTNQPNYMAPLASPTLTRSDDQGRNRVGDPPIASKHARIPQPLRTTYHDAPESTVYAPSDSAKAPGKYKAFTQQMNKSKSKGDFKLNKVSIEGRGIN